MLHSVGNIWDAVPWPLQILLGLYLVPWALLGITFAATFVVAFFWNRRVRRLHRKNCADHFDGTTCRWELQDINRTKPVKFLNWMWGISEYVLWWPVITVALIADAVVSVVCFLPKKWKARQRRIAEAIKQAEDERVAEERAAWAAEALKNARWEQINSSNWHFRGLSDGGGVFCFGRMRLRSIGHGLFAINYQKGHTLVDTSNTYDTIVMDGDKCIGDRQWAQAYAQRIIDEDFNPAWCTLRGINNSMMTDRMCRAVQIENRGDVVFVGQLYLYPDPFSRYSLTIWCKVHDYLESDTMWGMAWFKEVSEQSEHYFIRMGTNNVAQAVEDSIEALRQGMPPRHGLWAEVNTSA